MKFFFNGKYRYIICLKFGDKFLTSLTKLRLEAKATIFSTMKENRLLYCRKLMAFVIAVIIQHILIKRSVSQRKAACNRNHLLSP